MKKSSLLVALLVCAALLFTLAGCGTGTENDTTKAPGETVSDTAENTTATESTEATEKTSDTADTTETEKTSAPESTSPSGSETEAPSQPENDPHHVENKTKFDTTKHVFVTFVIKNMGEFQVELYPEYAPNTVTNFVNLADSGYYDGTKFHRVVDRFMAQGGINNDVEPESIYGEFQSNGFSQNTLKHERGVISMARANAPDSASGQFFICYDTCATLDGNYAAFGKVTYGMDVIDSFLEVERSINSLGEFAVPQEDIVIESATVSQ